MGVLLLLALSLHFSATQQPQKMAILANIYQKTWNNIKTKLFKPVNTQQTLKDYKKSLKVVSVFPGGC